MHWVIVRPCGTTLGTHERFCQLYAFALACRIPLTVVLMTEQGPVGLDKDGTNPLPLLDGGREVYDVFTRHVFMNDDMLKTTKRIHKFADILVSPDRSTFADGMSTVLRMVRDTSGVTCPTVWVLNDSLDLTTEEWQAVHCAGPLTRLYVLDTMESTAVAEEMTDLEHWNVRRDDVMMALMVRASVPSTTTISFGELFDSENSHVMSDYDRACLDVVGVNASYKGMVMTTSTACRPEVVRLLPPSLQSFDKELWGIYVDEVVLESSDGAFPKVRFRSPDEFTVRIIPEWEFLCGRAVLLLQNPEMAQHPRIELLAYYNLHALMHDVVVDPMLLSLTVYWGMYSVRPEIPLVLSSLSLVTNRHVLKLVEDDAEVLRVLRSLFVDVSLRVSVDELSQKMFLMNVYHATHRGPSEIDTTMEDMPHYHRVPDEWTENRTLYRRILDDVREQSLKYIREFVARAPTDPDVFRHDTLKMRQALEGRPIVEPYLLPDELLFPPYSAGIAELLKARDGWRIDWKLN